MWQDIEMLVYLKLLLYHIDDFTGIILALILKFSFIKLYFTHSELNIRNGTIGKVFTVKNENMFININYMVYYHHLELFWEVQKSCVSFIKATFIKISVEKYAIWFKVRKSDPLKVTKCLKTNLTRQKANSPCQKVCKGSYLDCNILTKCKFAIIYISKPLWEVAFFLTLFHYVFSSVINQCDLS